MEVEEEGRGQVFLRSGSVAETRALVLKGPCTTEPC